MIATSAWLNLVGLVLGGAGTFLLFVFGPPPSTTIQQGGQVLEIVVDAAPPEAVRKFEQAKKWGRVGLGLLFAGFALQLVGAIGQLPRDGKTTPAATPAAPKGGAS